MLVHHACLNTWGTSKAFFQESKRTSPWKCCHWFMCLWILCQFFSLLHLSASVAHTCFLSHSSGLVSSSLAFDHWLVRELACAFTAQNLQNPCDTEKPRTNHLPGTWVDCSLLILLKQLSFIVDLVTVCVKCCSCSSGCRFSHWIDGVLGKDHHSWRQEITRLLRL